MPGDQDDEDIPDIQQYIDKMNSSGYIIFGRDGCKYCTLAKE